MAMEKWDSSVRVPVTYFYEDYLAFLDGLRGPEHYLSVLYPRPPILEREGRIPKIFYSATPDGNNRSAR